MTKYCHVFRTVNSINGHAGLQNYIVLRGIQHNGPLGSYNSKGSLPNKAQVESAFRNMQRCLLSEAVIINSLLETVLMFSFTE